MTYHPDRMGRYIRPAAAASFLAPGVDMDPSVYTGVEGIAVGFAAHSPDL